MYDILYVRFRNPSVFFNAQLEREVKQKVFFIPQDLSKCVGFATNEYIKQAREEHKKTFDLLVKGKLL